MKYVQIKLVFIYQVLHFFYFHPAESVFFMKMKIHKIVSLSVHVSRKKGVHSRLYNHIVLKHVSFCEGLKLE